MTQETGILSPIFGVKKTLFFNNLRKKYTNFGKILFPTTL